MLSSKEASAAGGKQTGSTRHMPDPARPPLGRSVSSLDTGQVLGFGVQGVGLRV